MMPFDRYPQTTDEFEAAMLYFDEKFGKDPIDRLRKLHEECGELLEAIESTIEHVEKDDLTYEIVEHLSDEMADVTAVMAHYLWVDRIPYTLRDLVKYAAIKVYKRETDPNYKR